MIVVFDTETTGVDTDRDRIVQFAAIKLDESGSEVDRMKLLIYPQVHIPSAATAIHGISDPDVDGKPDFPFYADSILAFIGDADLCGHNMIAFDLPLLLAELKRCGRHMTLDGRRLFDTMEIFRVDVPHTLEGALKYYAGQSIGDDAHDAMVDTNACADVFARQAGLGLSDEKFMDKLAALSIGNRVTLDGKIVRDEDGNKCIGFGKHAGTPLSKVPHGYLRWMLNQDFSAETKAIVERYV